jgi:hypothetical protein
MATVMEELREKIKSKMEVGKFFAGFLTFLTGFLLKDGAPPHLLSKIGIVFLVGSIGFCVAAVFAYDTLLMPRKYWGFPEHETAEDRFADQLKANMVQSWMWLFVPAVACFGFGFVCVLIQALDLPTAECTLGPSVDRGLLALLLAGAVVSPIVVAFMKQPHFHD